MTQGLRLHLAVFGGLLFFIVSVALFAPDTIVSAITDVRVAERL